MYWYYRDLEKIVNQIIRKENAVWIIIYSEEIIIEMTGSCNRYRYIEGYWIKFNYIMDNRCRQYQIGYHKIYGINGIYYSGVPTKFILDINLANVQDIYYVTNSSESDIKDDTRLNQKNVLAELQSRLERPKMVTFWISDLLIKYE